MLKKTRMKKIFFIFSLSFLLLLCEDKTIQNLIELEVISSKLVFVKWEGKEKVDSYEVSRVIDNSKELLALFPSSITFYPDGGVEPGKRYCWEVKAKSAGQEISLGEACVKIPKENKKISPPPSPYLQIHIFDGNKIKIIWHGNGGEGIGFKILKKIQDKFVAIGLAPSSVTSFEIEEKEGKEHCYGVLAYGKGGDSEFSNIVCLSCPKVYRDSDGDGYGISEMGLMCYFKFSEFKFPTGITTLSGDCDDEDSKKNPEVFDLQDGIDNDCDGKVDDSGKIQVEYVCPLTFPGCDGIDNDEDGIIDEWSEFDYLWGFDSTDPINNSIAKERGEFLIRCLRPTNFQFSSTYIYTYETPCSTYGEREYYTGDGKKIIEVGLGTAKCKTPEFRDTIYPTRVTILYYKVTSEDQLICFSGSEIKVDFSKKFILAIGLYNERWYYGGDHYFVIKIYYEDGKLYIHIEPSKGEVIDYYRWEEKFPAPPYTDWDFIILEREYLNTSLIFVYKPCLCSESAWTPCEFHPTCGCYERDEEGKPSIPACSFFSIYQRTEILEK
jgi:hypothetical protein